MLGFVCKLWPGISALTHSQPHSTLLQATRPKPGDKNPVDGISPRPTDRPAELGSSDLDWDLWDSRYMLKEEESEEKWHGWCRPSCIPITIILVLIVLVVLLPLLDQKWEEEKREDLHVLQQQWRDCRTTCQLTIVESIPEGLVYKNSTTSHLSTFQGWMNLLNLATSTIEIGSFYWTLQPGDVMPKPDPSSAQGEQIFQSLMDAGISRKIQIKIAQTLPSDSKPNMDTKLLEKKGAAEVRSLDFEKLLGNGVLHTKMWIVDRKHAYIGSANFDWRSLTQVKELGVIIYNCSCFVKDLAKIFDVYWDLGKPDAKIPPKWPDAYDTIYNSHNPMDVAFNGTHLLSYISSSPPEFCPKGRNTDLDAILSVIDNAKKFVYISVMDYMPVTLYTPTRMFWPVIDDRLRAAAIERGVTVRLLISKWKHTIKAMPNFLQSLDALNQVYRNVNIEVKFFVVPSTTAQARIPFARVNHNKYMVTDTIAYIGTSNWSGDYFINTAGVGLVMNQTHTNIAMGRILNMSTTIRQQIQDIFERDWSSEHAKPLKEFFPS